jgi:hypothetical protein
MKGLILLTLVLAAVAILFACNRKNANQSEKPAPTVPVPTPPAGDKAPPKEGPYQMAGFEKTACFGKCPTFQVKFYSDGRVTYNGKMNVERLGMYEARTDNATLKRIKDKANEVGYFDFYNEYPVGKRIADLPSTITFLRVGDMEKQVKDTHEGPEKLKEFERYLEEIINGLTWKVVSDK